MVGYSMEYGIYPERPISHAKIGMILIGSKRIQENPGISSLLFIGMEYGVFVFMGERMGGVVEFFVILQNRAPMQPFIP